RGTPGTTHYGYKVVGFREGDHTAASPEATIDTGPLALSIGNSVLITPPLVAHVTSWDIYRTTGGTTQGRLGEIVPIIVDDVQLASFLAFGQVADGLERPSDNTSGQLYVSEVVESSLFYAGPTGQVLPLAPAPDGRVLTIIDGVPAWAAGPGLGAN